MRLHYFMITCVVDFTFTFTGDDSVDEVITERMGILRIIGNTEGGKIIGVEIIVTFVYL